MYRLTCALSCSPVRRRSSSASMLRQAASALLDSSVACIWSKRLPVMSFQPMRSGIQGEQYAFACHADLCCSGRTGLTPACALTLLAIREALDNHQGGEGRG